MENCIRDIRLTHAPPDSRLRWMVWDAGSLKQDPAAGELNPLAILDINNMVILFKYFPLFALLYSVIPAFFRRNIYRSVPDYNPENASKFKTAYWGSVIYMAIVWLPMIIGIQFGGVPSMLHFFVRGTGNPFVNSYWIVQLTLSIVGIVWVYFLNGGEFIEEYYLPLMSSRGKGSNLTPISPSFVKLIPVISCIVIIILWLFILPDDVTIIDEMFSGLQ